MSFWVEIDCRGGGANKAGKGKSRTRVAGNRWIQVNGEMVGRWLAQRPEIKADIMRQD